MRISWTAPRIGLDAFDASINHIAAWTISTRNAFRALLLALLGPIDWVPDLEPSGDDTQRLALLEGLKGLPFGAMWDYYIIGHGLTTVAARWLSARSQISPTASRN